MAERALEDDWFEGSFEGVYTGERLRGGDEPADARRFSLDVISGRVASLAPSAPPPPEHDPARSRPVIRQARVRDVELSESPGGGEARVLTLFDVHIDDWTLRHPAEAEGRSYGTIIGRIRARLRPPPPPAEPPARPPADAEAPSRPVARLHGRRRTAGPTGRGRHVDGVDGTTAFRRVRWVAALFFVATVAAGVAAGCRSEAAIIYLAPVLAAFLLRALARPIAGWRSGLQTWLAILLVAIQIAWLWGPVAALLGPACGTAIVGPWAGLAAPVLLTAWMRIRWPVVVTVLGWSLAVCLQCGALGGGCTGATAIDSGAPAAAVSRDSPRTDADGRWPAPPGPIALDGPTVREPAGFGLGGLDGLGNAVEVIGGLLGQLAGLAWPGGDAPLPSTVPEADPTATQPGTELSGLAVPGGQLELRPLSDLRNGAPGATRASGADLSTGSDASSTPIEALPSSRPPPYEVARPDYPAPPESTPAGTVAPARAPRGDVAGGWLAPDHRRADREVTLISVEQANRTPADFYGGEGHRRVYLPTDPIFEPGGSRLRPQAGLALTRLAALLALQSEQRLVVEVHTDAGGGSEAQQRLSERRATEVRDWLLDRGHLDGARFRAVGVGARHPLVPPDGSFADQWPNRRIEVRLVE